MVGSFINEFLPWQDLISYLDAILRVYNRYGRRDNKYKARIKILVKALTPQVFAEKVEAEMAHLRGGNTTLTEAEIERVSRHFVDPAYQALDNVDYAELDQEFPGFARWRSRNTRAHKRPGYVAVTLSLKPTGVARATSPTSGWTPLPIWPSATASASCGPRTSRTSSLPMSSSVSCTRSGKSCAKAASPRRTSVC